MRQYINALQNHLVDIYFAGIAALSVNWNPLDWQWKAEFAANDFGHVLRFVCAAARSRAWLTPYSIANGPEMATKVLREWLTGLGTRNLYIEPGSPWENGYSESFNGKLIDECLNCEIFYSLRDAQVVIEKWRNQHNTKRAHFSLGYWPPAPLTMAPKPTPLDKL